MPTVQGAVNYLNENAHIIFKDTKSMVYVGHRSDTHPWWRVEFASAIGNPAISIMDIQQTNLDQSKGVVLNCVDFILGDIRKPNDLKGGYELVFWDEGPEHVSKVDALVTIEMLMKKNKHVLISCPWGYQAQGSGPSDPEFHHWAPMPEDFESIGMTAMTFGTMFPGGHGNLIAWA